MARKKNGNGNGAFMGYVLQGAGIAAGTLLIATIASVLGVAGKKAIDAYEERQALAGQTGYGVNGQQQRVR